MGFAEALVRVRMWWTAHGEQWRKYTLMVLSLVLGVSCLAGLSGQSEHECSFANTDSCPQFTEISSRRVVVKWQPPSQVYLVRRYELHVIETYSADETDVDEVRTRPTEKRAAGR